MKKYSCPNIAKKLIALLIVSLIFAIYFQSNIYALTSENINFQGKIVRNDTGYEGLNIVPGTPACVVAGPANDSCDFQVSYYTAATGGTLLLRETFNNVEIGQYDGVFELSLGSGSMTTTPQCRDGICNNPLEVISEYKDLYIELKFAPDGTNLTETFSRMPLEATAYSILSKFSEGANDAFKLSTSLSPQTQSSPVAGMVYYNTTSSQLTVYNGTSWQGINSSLWTDAGTFTYLTSTTDDLVLGASTVSDSTFYFDMDGSSGSYLEIDNASNSSRLFTILSGGNVGIGTANPTAKLEVAGSSSTITNSSGDLTLSTGGLDGDILFSPNGAGKVKINSAFGVRETGTTPTFYTFFQGGDQSGDITYTLPTSSSTGLLKNTAGVLSWDTSTYITGLNWSQVTNGSGVYMDYRPNNVACGANQVLKYTVGTGWVCASDTDTGDNWGSQVVVTDTLALAGNGTSGTPLDFNYTATLASNPAMAAGETIFGSTGILFEGSSANTYETLLTVANPTTDITITLPNATGTVPLGTGTANYIAYWTGTNTLGSEQRLAISRGGTNASTYTSNQFLWYNGSSIVASGYNQNSFATAAHTHNWSQITNGSGIYMDYRPNDVACSANQVLKYTVGTGWVCADDIDTNTDGNNYVDSVSFNSTNGVLTLGRTGALGDLTTSLDGRYLQSFTEADTLQTVTDRGATTTIASTFSTSIRTPLLIGNNSLGIRAGANSTTAIQLQNASGTSILNVDTTNSRVGIGTTAPSRLLQLGQAGTAGTLGIAGSTSGLVTLQTAAAAGTWTMTLPTSAGTSGQVLTTNGSGVTSWASAGAASNVALSGITAAISANSISSGDYAQVWNWQLTSANKVAFTFGENAASTATGSPAILSASTLASSTAMPLYIKNLGNANSFRVDDEASDTTPFVIDASGNVGIGTASPNQKLQVHKGTLLVKGTQIAGSGSDYTINGILNSNQVFSETGTSAIIGYNYYNLDSSYIPSLPTLGSYGTVGVTGFAASSHQDGTASVGVYGYAVHRGRHGATGGHFAADSESGATRIMTLYGTRSSASSIASSIPGNSVYASHNSAQGISGDTTYGGYFTATGGTTNYAIYSVAGINYFAGNVGIGTTSPTYRLDVAGDINTTGTYRMAGLDYGQYFIDSAGTNGQVWKSDGVGRGYWGTDDTGTALPAGTSGQTIRHDGTAWVANSLLYNNGTNIGIGTTNPGAKLDVAGAFGTGTTAQLITNTSGAAVGNIAQLGFALNRTTGGLTEVAQIRGLITDIGNTTSKGALAFLTSTNNALPTEKMRIDANGNVGIGTDTPEEMLHLKKGVYPAPAPAIRFELDKAAGGSINNGQAWGSLDFYRRDVNVGKIVAEAPGNGVDWTRFKFQTRLSDGSLFDLLTLQTGSAGGNATRVGVGLNATPSYFMSIGPSSGTGVSDGTVSVGVGGINVRSGTYQQYIFGIENTDYSGAGSNGLLVKAGSGSGNITFHAVNGSNQSLLFVRGDGRIGIGTTSPSTLLQLGQAGKAGTLGIAGSTSGLVTLQTAAAAGTWTMTLPTGTGSNGQVLTTNGSGVTSWTSPSSSVKWNAIGNPDGHQVLTMGAYNSTWNFTTGVLRITNNSAEALYVGGGNVGIGTTSPATKLHIATDGGILAQGTEGTGWDGGSLGAGTRLMWIPGKAAFRAGGVDNDEWNASNIGRFSVAMGAEVTARGTGSIAMGNVTTASGDNSIAMGAFTWAGGEYSTAMGFATNTSGTYSTAMGIETIASGSASTAMGDMTTASGQTSTAMGAFTQAGGNYSTAIGAYTSASGSASIAMGYNTSASGSSSTAMGYYTTAQASASTVLGSYNVISGSTDSWIATDPIFAIGIGTDSSNRANAMTVLKSGNVGIGTTTPVAKLEISTSSASTNTALLVSQSGTSATMYATYSVADGTGATNNIAGYFSALGGTNNYGLLVANGNVGIGTTTPSNKFVVNTSAYSTIELQYNGTSVVDIFSNTSSNIFIGLDSGSVISTGIGNVAIGDNALSANTSGTNNTAVGHYALDRNVAKQGSTAFGYQAMMFANSSAAAGLTYNTAVGYQALTGSGNPVNNTGVGNTAIGHQSLTVNTSGSYNTGLGVNTLNANTTGAENVAIGYGSLFTNVAKQGSVAVGYEAMRYANSNATVDLTYNTAVGYQALRGSTTAANNTGTTNSVFGYKAGFSSTSGSSNTFMGGFSGYANTTGTDNVAVGNTSMMVNQTGQRNIAIGSYALGMNSMGDHSSTVVIGYYAMGEAAGGTVGNIGIGSSALFGVSGSYNTVVGHGAGEALTTGGYNILIGQGVQATSPIGDYQLNIGNTIYGDLSTGYLSIGDSTPTEAMFTVGATSQFRVDSNGNLTRINNVPYSWPSSNTSGVLANNGSGTLTWTSLGSLGVVTGSGTGSGTAGQVTWWNGTSMITGSSTLWWDNSNSRLGIGTSSPQASLDIAGATSTISNASGNITIAPASNLIVSQGNVGIGTTSPVTKLHIANDGGILAQGTYSSGWDGGSLGAGSRLMWIPNKSAFRAGYVSGTQWNASNIGDYSVAMGVNTTASGGGSTATGYGTSASGSYSIAMGYIATASGQNSIAMGYSATASGSHSAAIGQYTAASGNMSTAMGNYTTASGNLATAIGYYTTAQAHASTVLGRYNEIAGSTSSWIGTDPIFAIGIGANSSNRANAMTVLKNGNVGIGTASPTVPLQVERARTTSINSSSAAYKLGGNDVYLFGQSYGTSPWGHWMQVMRPSDDTPFPLSLQPLGGVVGIGTIAPVYKLDVTGNIGINSGSTYKGVLSSIEVPGTYGWTGVEATSSGANSSYKSFKFHVTAPLYDSSTSVATVYYIGSTQYGQLAYNQSAGYLDKVQGAADSSSLFYIRFGTSYTNRFQLRGDGVGLADTSWTTFSPYLSYNYTEDGKSKSDYKLGEIVSQKSNDRWSVTQSSDTQNTLYGVVVVAEGFVSVPKELKYNVWDGGGSLENNPYVIPVAHLGEASTMVSIMPGEKILEGDPISTSQYLGIGAKAVKEGQIVGRALESTNVWNVASCLSVSSIDNITWPADDGSNPTKPCFKLPDGTIVGKIMVFVNVSWYNPSETYTTTNISQPGWYRVSQLNGSDEIAKFKINNSSIGSSQNLILSVNTANNTENVNIVSNFVSGGYDISKARINNVGGFKYLEIYLENVNQNKVKVNIDGNSWISTDITRVEGTPTLANEFTLSGVLFGVSDVLEVRENGLMVKGDLLSTNSASSNIGNGENRWNDIYAKGAIRLGSGSGQEGAIRFNTETMKLELSSNGGEWIPLGDRSSQLVLSPEYPGAILFADGSDNLGKMTSDAIEESNGTFKNYYEWVSNKEITQDYDILVRITLPNDFVSWKENAVSLDYMTENSVSVENNSVDVSLIGNSGVDAVSNGHISKLPGAWERLSIQSSDINDCNTPGGSCTLRISLKSSMDYFVRVGDITLNYNRSL